MTRRAADRWPRRGAEGPRSRSAGIDGWVSGAPEPVGERLDAGSLPDGEGAVLIGMDVPVAVLGDVGSDGPAEVVPLEALVLVGEDVASIPLQMRRQILVCPSGLQKRECLSVVRADRPGDVVEDERQVLVRHRVAEPPLEGLAGVPRYGMHPPAVRRDRREIADGVTEGVSALGSGHANVCPDRSPTMKSRKRCCGTP